MNRDSEKPFPLTLALGRFVSALRYQDIPKDAIPFVHTAFTDTIGVMIAGADEPAPQLLKTMLAPTGSEATLLFSNDRASALDAAWINGTAAHVLDFDDVAQRGHPSVVLVPAILAEAEALGASGAQMVTAYVTGYETWAELVKRDPDHQHERGWHPTGIFGAVAAAAACASLHALDGEKAACAIALGASQSAGLISNFGTMAKPFHGGRAAHAGVASARLAKSGFTAALDALEHDPGFLAAISVNNRYETLSPMQAGIVWRLPRDRFSVKKYPLCFATHRALDSLFDLLSNNKVEAEEVSRITVGINRRHATVLRNHQPQTGLEAKFSMEFAMACGIIAKRAGLPEIADEFVQRSDIQALMKRVVLTQNAEDPGQAGVGIDDQITIETKGGLRLEKKLTPVRGGPDLPLTKDEVWQKFAGCVEVSSMKISARSLFDALMSLSDLTHVRQIYGAALSRPCGTAV